MQKLINFYFAGEMGGWNYIHKYSGAMIHGCRIRGPYVVMEFEWGRLQAKHGL